MYGIRVKKLGSALHNLNLLLTFLVSKTSNPTLTAMQEGMQEELQEEGMQERFQEGMQELQEGETIHEPNFEIGVL